MFGKEFKKGAMDRSFYDEKKINELENKYDISLAISYKKNWTKKLIKKKQKLYNQRSAIESKISEGGKEIQIQAVDFLVHRRKIYSIIEIWRYKKCQYLKFQIGINYF